MNLLIFTPTWITERGTPAMHPDCRTAIETQRLQAKMKWAIGYENPYPIGDYRNVLQQYQTARCLALEGGYDALLTVEHDNVLPDPEAVQRMLDTPGDIIYAPYLLRHGLRVLSTWQYINDRNLGMSLSGYRAELKRAREEVVHRVSGAGFGGTLIRRHVLEAIEFTPATARDRNECPDLRFAEDCLRKHFMAYGRFDVPVLHWEGNGWLHPFQNRRNGVADYIALETMNALAAGRHVRLVKDATIALSDEEAAELARLGVIRSASGLAPSLAVEPEAQTPPLAAEVETVAPARRNRARTLKKAP